MSELAIKITFTDESEHSLRATVEFSRPETDELGELDALSLARATLSRHINLLRAGVNPPYLVCTRPVSGLIADKPIGRWPKNKKMSYFPRLSLKKFP